MDISLIHSIWTIAVLVIFIGIVAWAYSSQQREAFEEAARIPLDDDASNLSTNSTKEQ